MYVYHVPQQKWRQSVAIRGSKYLLGGLRLTGGVAMSNIP